MKYKHNGEIIDAKIEAFCFWECGYIGVNITKDGRFIDGFDIPIEEARAFRNQLSEMIEHYDNLEAGLQEKIHE